MNSNMPVKARPDMHISDMSDMVPAWSRTDEIFPTKILIVALNYAPELIGCGRYTSELAEDLVARGHEVEVVTTAPYYPDWVAKLGFSSSRWTREKLNSVIVHRVPLYVPHSPTGFKRIAHLASFGITAMPTALRVAWQFKPDLVLGVAPTLASAASAIAAAKVVGARRWLHIQDYEVDAAFELGMLRSSITRKIALRIERMILRRFDRVSSISEAMVSKLIAKGIAPAKVSEVRNWVDVDAVPVYPSSNTSYRRELNIPADNIVALYSGNMSTKQGIEALGEIAAHLDALDAPVTMIFCGAGPARTALEQSCSGLGNVRFLPLQPLDRLPELLGTADIHLLPQRPEAANLVLPSKLTGMLASGRPVVAMADAGTGLAMEVQGCGLAVPATAAAMSAAILQLVGNSDLRRSYGKGARRRAELAWRKTSIIGTFAADLDELVGKRHSLAVQSN